MTETLKSVIHWRSDIENAPTDGTWVLVYAEVIDPEKWGIDLKPVVCPASYHPDGGWCVCTIREATMWAELPPPPKARR